MNHATQATCTSTTGVGVAGVARAGMKLDVHGEHEKRTGQHDANWPNWYAAYSAAEQAGKELPQ